jgi:transposase InsO family protein
MSERTSEAQRVAFYQRHVRGETYAQIAQVYGVSLECVRYWCQKQKKGLGVKSTWRFPKQAVLSHFDPKVSQSINNLRAQHPRWGPISLGIHLEDELDLKGNRLPSPASIGRFLYLDPANRRRPKVGPPKLPAVPLTHAHQRWEIDFKVKIHLDCGLTVQLHTVKDPFSGAHIGACVYVSEPETSRVPLLEVQATLRACFTEWGTLPEEIQTDGEPILAATRGELPTGFTLWLSGLGVDHRTIRPGCPTQNGSVERDHRTLNEYSLQGQLDRSPADLQAYLDQCRQELNTRYPSRAKGCGGQPPLSAHPELLQPFREYRPENEEGLFDLGRVDALLARYRWERKVGKNGQITLGGEHEYYLVGRAFAQQSVWVSFDPDTRQFVAKQLDEEGHLQEIKRWPARNVEASQLLWPGDPPPNHCPQQLALPFPWSEWVKELKEKVKC